MKLRTFNMVASTTAFLLGAVYVLSDGASVTANVIGASGGSAGLTSIMGLVMIISAIGLFIVSMHSTANHTIDLERLVRKTKYNTELKNLPEQNEEYKEAVRQE